MRQDLVKNVPGSLLQYVTVLLKNAIVITKCDNFLTKYDSFCKMQRLLQIATVQTYYPLFKNCKKHFTRITYSPNTR